MWARRKKDAWEPPWGVYVNVGARVGFFQVKNEQKDDVAQKAVYADT